MGMSHKGNCPFRAKMGEGSPLWRKTPEYREAPRLTRAAAKCLPLLAAVQVKDVCQKKNHAAICRFVTSRALFLNGKQPQSSAKRKHSSSEGRPPVIPLALIVQASVKLSTIVF